MYHRCEDKFRFLLDVKSVVTLSECFYYMYVRTSRRYKRKIIEKKKRFENAYG